MLLPMGVIYHSRYEGGRAVGDIEQYTKYFLKHHLSVVLRNDGGLWMCEAIGRHGDLPFSARGERVASLERAVYTCFVATRSHLRSEPYIMG